MLTVTYNQLNASCWINKKFINLPNPTFEEYIIVPNILSSNASSSLTASGHYWLSLYGKQQHKLLFIPRRKKITRVWKHTQVWVKDDKTFNYFCMCMCIRRYRKVAMKLAENQRQTLFVCHRFSACRYTCHTEIVKNAGCGLICRQMQQFCPCQHCDVLTALTWTLPGLRRFYAELPPTCSASLACCLSIHQRTCLPVDILTISYRHVSLKAFFSVW